jgi:hypothetical protein
MPWRASAATSDLHIERVVVRDVIAVAASCPRFEVRRSIDVAHSERVQIGHEPLGVAKGKVAAELQPVGCARGRGSGHQPPSACNPMMNSTVPPNTEAGAAQFVGLDIERHAMAPALQQTFGSSLGGL